MALAVAAKPRIAAAIFIFGGVGYRADRVWSLANEEIMMVMPAGWPPAFGIGEERGI
jgi:hypothetical protein